MHRLFIAQELLDRWAEQGKIQLAGSQLRLLAESRLFQLQPASRFVSLAAGADRNGLLGRIKTEDQVQALGGELYRSSVLFGEDSYDVQNGFLIEVAGEAARASPEPAPARPAAAAPAAPAPPKVLSSEELEKDLLAKYLLEDLN
jgi:hypothetical protein